MLENKLLVVSVVKPSAAGVGTCLPHVLVEGARQDMADTSPLPVFSVTNGCPGSEAPVLKDGFPAKSKGYYISTMQKRFKYRLYPHPHQRQALAQVFGCARVVWNDALALKQEAWKERQERLSINNLMKVCITQARQTPERSWLKQVHVTPLQQSLRDLDKAFKSWWKSLKGKGRAKAPRFKRRHNRQAIRFNRGGFCCGDHAVRIGKVGEIPIIWSRPLPAVPSSATVIKDCAGRYFVSFVVQVERPCSPPVKGAIGIDLGLASLASTSDGEKMSPPKFLRSALRRLRRLQRNPEAQATWCQPPCSRQTAGSPTPCQGRRPAYGFSASALYPHYP